MIYFLFREITVTSLSFSRFRYLLRDFTLNSLSFSRNNYKYTFISRNQYEFIICFAFHYEYTILSVSRISYEFTITIANSVSKIHFKYAICFANFLSIRNPLRNFTMNSLSFFAKTLLIHYLFRQSTFNTLSVSRYPSQFTICFAYSL